MKLRLLPILIAVFASSALLFGGWFIYHSAAMENPLNHIATGSPGVQNAQTQINSAQVTIDLKLNNTADVRDLYSKIMTQGESVIGKRDLKLKLDSNTSPELEKWWSSALFEVAQAMETKRYADIPQGLKAKAAQLPNLTVDTEMDDINVYVRLTDGVHSKYIILPRKPAVMGVWTQ
ncbi:MAG: hypothetical protein JWM44_3925 [Bacilli bacterium]|nr:hypothetical protein [Bacilli bacterium]